MVIALEMPPPKEGLDAFKPMPLADETGSSAADRLCLYLSTSEIAAATFAWSVCSVGITVLNKMVITKTHAPLAVVIVQMIATVTMALASRDIHFGKGTQTWAIAVPPLFALMLLTSMLALDHVTVGTFMVVRNLGPVVTLVIETAVHKPDSLELNWKTGSACGTIALGVLIYEIREISFSFIGFLLLLANLALGVTERIVQRHLLAVSRVDVSQPALMVLNNGLGAIYVLMIVVIMSPHEFHALYHAIKFKHHMASAVLASCVLGCGISYAGLWLQKLVTATTFMVVGSFTKAIVILYGILLLDDSQDSLSILGAFLSIAGSYAYVMLK